MNQGFRTKTGTELKNQYRTKTTCQHVSNWCPIRGLSDAWQADRSVYVHYVNVIIMFSSGSYISAVIFSSYIPGGSAISLLHPQPAGTDGQHQTPVHCITPLVLMGKNGAQMSLPGTVASVPTGLPLADVGNTTLSTHTPHSGTQSGGVSAAAMSLLSSQQQVSTAASCSHCCQYRACN